MLALYNHYDRIRLIRQFATLIHALAIHKFFLD